MSDDLGLEQLFDGEWVPVEEPDPAVTALMNQQLAEVKAAKAKAKLDQPSSDDGELSDDSEELDSRLNEIIANAMREA